MLCGHICVPDLLAMTALVTVALGGRGEELFSPVDLLAGIKYSLKLFLIDIIRIDTIM